MGDDVEELWVEIKYYILNFNPYFFVKLLKQEK